MGVDVKHTFWRSVWTGYVFWSLFSSLPAMIWFYPLNQLDITGYEAFVLILLLPFILRYRLFRQFFQTNTGDLFLKIFCLIGIFSFRCPTTLQRLFFLTLGTGAAVMKFACDLMLPDIGKKKYSFWGYTVGFMAVLCTRIWYRSIMPAFNDDTSNLLIFTVTFLNALATIVSFEQTPPSISQTEKIDAEKTDQHRNANFLLTSIGVGSLFYVMHAIFGEVSTPCRWINGPHPSNVGPIPVPWGLAIYFALLAGFVLSSRLRLIYHPFWSIGALAAFMIMYTTYGWIGFVGAIFLAVYIASVWPTYVDLLFRRLPVDRIGPAVALAMMVYVAEVLFSVWTVAYNFVPGGVYTREGTGYLIITVMSFIGIGIYWHVPASFDISNQLAFTKLQHASKIPLSRVWGRFFILTILATSGMMWRYNAWNPGSLISSNSTNNFTAMIWTYHFGYDNRGWPSLERTVTLINNLQADVVGLLETDASRPYMGNNDLAQWLAENLQMYVDFGPNTRQHTWGSMLLSRFPILYSEHHLLPSPRGELAPAISAVLNISGTPTGVVVTHFGNDVDDEDRKLQAKTISQITSKFYAEKIPAVFLGYVTSKPQSRDYFTLLDTGRMSDIDESDWDRFCEYILYNRLHRLAYARVSHGGLSDTEIQVAKFKIPESNIMKSDEFQDNYGNTVTDPTVISINQRFPDSFGGFYNGHYFRWDQHHFHMSTPKYFLPMK